MGYGDQDDGDGEWSMGMDRSNEMGRDGMGWRGWDGTDMASPSLSLSLSSISPSPTPSISSSKYAAEVRQGKVGTGMG